MNVLLNVGSPPILFLSSALSFSGIAPMYNCSMAGIMRSAQKSAPKNGQPTDI